MERYIVEAEIPKEAAYNGQMPIPNMIGMMMQQNDVYPHDLKIDIDDTGATFKVKMKFMRNSDIIIRGGS
jgi:hypothetical protein